MKLKINVKQKHIENGQPHSNSCPIALALKDEGFEYIDVDSVEIIFTTKKGSEIKIPSSSKVKRFIERFDNENGKNLKVKPTVFTLAI